MEVVVQEIGGVELITDVGVGPHGERHCQLANIVELLGGHLPKSMARNLILR